MFAIKMLRNVIFRVLDLQIAKGAFGEGVVVVYVDVVVADVDGVVDLLILISSVLRFLFLKIRHFDIGVRRGAKNDNNRINEKLCILISQI
jgi:hypothetical protein